jgi:hypothetical protein
MRRITWSAKVCPCGHRREVGIKKDEGKISEAENAERPTSNPQRSMKKAMEDKRNENAFRTRTDSENAQRPTLNEERLKPDRRKRILNSNSLGKRPTPNAQRPMLNEEGLKPDRRKRILNSN